MTATRIAVVLAAVAMAGCSRAPAPEPSIEGTPLADIASVAAEDETSYEDLPGVEGFEQLSPTLQVAVVARANRARCDCGCPRHSVNACLHQDDRCDVALGLARGFVADAQALALNAPGPSATTPEGPAPSEVVVPPAEAAPPEGVAPPADAGTSPPSGGGEPSPIPSGASAPGVPPPT